MSDPPGQLWAQQVRQGRWGWQSASQGDRLSGWLAPGPPGRRPSALACNPLEPPGTSLTYALCPLISSLNKGPLKAAWQQAWKLVPQAPVASCQQHHAGLHI